MAEYPLDYSELEKNRLDAQDDVVRSITERLLRIAGLRPGMRVLDVGCGSGTVSVLVARLLGSHGSVTGIDLAAPAIEMAESKARQEGMHNITFLNSSLESFSDAQPYDFVIGRYVLIFQPFPANFVRTAASHVHPGGVIAFQEVDALTSFETQPPVPFIDEMMAEMVSRSRSVLVTPQAAGRLVSIFAEAELTIPHLFCERPMAGGKTAVPFCRYLTTTVARLRSLQHPGDPMMDVDKLTAEMAVALIDARSQWRGLDECCAWTTV